MTSDVSHPLAEARRDWDADHPLIASNFFSNGITALAFCVGLLGLAVQAYFSNDTNERQAAEQEKQTFIARQLLYDEMWTGYMELAIAFPRYAEGPRSVDGRSISYSELSDLEQVQYQWFFDRLAYTAESIMELEPNSIAWSSVFEDEFAKHSSLLAENPNIMPKWFCYYDASVRPFMVKAVSGRNLIINDCPTNEAEVVE
jgi:hypothetical protein